MESLFWISYSPVLTQKKRYLKDDRKRKETYYCKKIFLTTNWRSITNIKSNFLVTSQIYLSTTVRGGMRLGFPISRFKNCIWPCILLDLGMHFCSRFSKLTWSLYIFFFDICGVYICGRVITVTPTRWS